MKDSPQMSDIRRMPYDEKKKIVEKFAEVKWANVFYGKNNDIIALRSKGSKEKDIPRSNYRHINWIVYIIKNDMAKDLKDLIQE